MNTTKISLFLLLCCASCAAKNDNNMDKLIQAVIEQDKAFLEKNLTSKNINTICDFSVIHTMNIHLSDDTEHSEFINDDEKGTLLHLTAWYNLPISAKILMEKGSDVNAKDAQGRTPLEVAANRYDVVTYPVQRVLIENKADMNFYVTKNFLNEPLLFCYIHWRQFELAELAIENGADVNMITKDYGGDSILKFAEQRGTPKIVSMLKAKGAK
jgi:FOG: Ankyrin repeat